MSECGGENFQTSKIEIGKKGNIIAVDVEGNMVFFDSSLTGTSFEETGVPLSLIAGITNGLGDLNDVNISDCQTGQFIKLGSDDIWRCTFIQNTTIVTVKKSKWSPISVRGETYYQATVPHVTLDNPLDLGVELWDENNNRITLHNVQHNKSDTILQSTEKLKLFVVFRKAE